MSSQAQLLNDYLYTMIMEYDRLLWRSITCGAITIKQKGTNENKSLHILYKGTQLGTRMQNALINYFYLCYGKV